jgi:hypothetical protein
MSHCVLHCVRRTPFRALFGLSLFALLPVLAACRANSTNNPTQPSAATTASGTSSPSSLTASIVAPRPVTPTNGALIRNLDQPVTLVVQNAVVTRSGSPTYTFEVGADSAFGTKVQTKDGIAEGGGGQTSTRLGQLDPNKTYYWHARAVAGGTTGAFGPVHSFTIGPAIVVNAPVPVGPLTGTQTTARPTFTVTNPDRQIPAGSVVVYLFEIATNPGFSAVPITSPKVPEGPVQTSFTPGVDLSPNQAYYWRATAIDSTDGISSPASAVQTFTVAAGPPPNQTQQGQIALQLYSTLWPGDQPSGTNGHAVLGDGWDIHTEFPFYGGSFQSPTLQELQVFDLLDRGMDPQGAIDWIHAHYGPSATSAAFYVVGGGVQVIGFSGQYMALQSGQWHLIHRVGA